jgi:hypothetical protein
VTASDGVFATAYSLPSAKVVVDKTRPSPPTLTPSRAADYTSTASGSWWKGSVTVTVASSGDPVLADGSTGSGVDPASVAAPVTVSTNGATTLTQTVRDRVGNTSVAATLKVQVDATPPTMKWAYCPTSLYRGTTRTATWSESDGQSGPGDNESGSVQVGNSKTGTYSATATGQDAVGNSASITCTYKVT